MHASWNQVSSDPTVLANIATELGFGSVDELPSVHQITDAQLQVIHQNVGPEVANKVKSNLGEVANPTLEPTTIDLGDASALTLLMMALHAKLGEIQTNTAKEGVKCEKLRLEDVSEQRIQKLKDAIEKMSKAEKSGLASKILGWTGAIVGLIAAIAVTVVTGGALAGVALTLAIVGIGLMIAQETGGMDKLMTAMFKDDEKAKMWFQIALTAALLIASIATMGAGAASAAKNVGDAVKVTSTVAKLASVTGKSTEAVTSAARMTQLAASVVGALVGLGSGAATVHTSVTSYEATEATAESKELEAWLAQLQSQLEDEQERLQKAIEELNQGFPRGVDMLESIKGSQDTLNQHARPV